MRQNKLLGWIAALLLPPLIGLVAVLGTETGTRWAVYALQHVMAGRLLLTQVHGRLAGPVRVEGLVYRDRGASYRIESARLDWRPLALGRGELAIDALHLVGVSVHRFEAEPGAKRPPQGFPSVALPLRVRIRDLRIEHLSIQSGRAAPVRVQRLALRGGLAAGVLRIATLELSAPGWTVDGRGRIGLAPRDVLDLRLSWTLDDRRQRWSGIGRLGGRWDAVKLSLDLRRPFAASVTANVTSPFASPTWKARLDVDPIELGRLSATAGGPRLGAHLRLQGDLHQARIGGDLQTDAGAAALRTLHLDIALEREIGGVRWRSFDVRLPSGVVHAVGETYWHPALRWRFDISAQGIDPQVYFAGWPGRVDMALSTSGQDRQGELETSVEVTKVSGELRGQALDGGGRLQQRGNRYRLSAVRLQAGAARLMAVGEIGERWALHWSLQADDLSRLTAHQGGALALAGSVDGPREKPRVEATLEGSRLASGELAIAELQGRIAIDFARWGTVQAAIDAGQVRLGPRTLERAVLSINGLIEEQTIELEAQGPGVGLTLKANGGLHAGHWSGRVSSADWLLPETGAWRLHRPVSVEVGSDSMRVTEACWAQQQGRLCLSADVRAGHLERLQAALQNASLASFRGLYPPRITLAGRIDAQITATTADDGSLRGRASLHLPPAEVEVNTAAETRRFPYWGLEASFELNADGLALAAELGLTGDDTLSVRGDLPGLRLPARIEPTQALRLKLRGRLAQWSLVNAVLRDVAWIEGRLELDADVGGSVGEPDAGGQLRLSGGSVQLPAVGVRLQQIELVFSGAGTRGIDFDGRLSSGPGRLDLKGRLTGAPTGNWRVQASLKGDSFQIVNTPEVELLVSPVIDARIEPGEVRLDGELLLPKARIEQPQLAGAVEPSPDVVIVGRAQPAPGWQVWSRLHIRLGDDVHYKGYGFSGRITGELEVSEQPGRIARGRGVLSVAQGVYKAYGQELTIREGRLIFSDSPLDDPALDIRAQRQAGEVTAGLQIGGTLSRLESSLYAEPPQSDTDTLAYLFTGRPASAATEAQGSLLYQAASSLGVSGGNALAANIAQAFGLDTLSVSAGGTGGPSVQLGKRLAGELSVFYSVGVFDAISRIRIEYRISRRISVEAEAGPSSSADIVYTLER